MKNEKNKKLYIIISITIIIILSIFIILTFKNIYGNSSKQIKKSYEFIENLQRINAISKEGEIELDQFQEVKRINEFSSIKYTVVNGEYVVELNKDYKVTGFLNQDIKVSYIKEVLSEGQCIEYSRKYLENLYKGNLTFKEVREENMYDNPFYTVAYYKMHNDYVCYSNEILVKIDKYDGSLVGYSNYSDDNIEFSSKINITGENCKSIFESYMKELGLEGEMLGKPKVGYININGEENQLCYIIVYRIREKDNEVKFNDIIINTNNGEIVKHSNNIIELMPTESLKDE